MHTCMHTRVHKFRQQTDNFERGGTPQNLLRCQSGQLIVIKLECNDGSRKENERYKHVNMRLCKDIQRYAKKVVILLSSF